MKRHISVWCFAGLSYLCNVDIEVLNFENNKLNETYFARCLILSNLHQSCDAVFAYYYNYYNLLMYTVALRNMLTSNRNILRL